MTVRLAGLVLAGAGIFAACAGTKVVDPGPQSWSGRLTCKGLTTAECNAAQHAVLTQAGVSMAIAIEISPGAACPTGVPDCSYAILPSQRLLGHAIIDLGNGRIGYMNIWIDGDGSVTADPIAYAPSPSA